ncbi:MAG: M1 family peptidase, partial [Pyrinomonadaceae bacterium]
MLRKLLIITITLFAGANLFAQNLYMPRNVQNAFNMQTRSADGNPGKNYWQNTANYDIKISLAPPDRKITGSEEITYFNNSPNQLNSIVIRLELNSHQAEAPRADPISTDYLTSGVTLDEFTVNGVVQPGKGEKGRTWREVKLEKPLAKKSSIKLGFKWHYDMSVKSGREGAITDRTFFLAYFYPRVAVYDDVDGWDKMNFIESHEFYNDFNNYALEVTAPKNFVVYATGDLQNPNDVLQPKIAARLKDSMTSESVIHMATEEELKNGLVTKQQDSLTWKFKAEKITDIAAATSDYFLWDAGSVVVDNKTNRRASVQAVYDKESADFQQMVEFGKHGLSWASNN